jgi:hypothetical protein
MGFTDKIRSLLADIDSSWQKAGQSLDLPAVAQKVSEVTGISTEENYVSNAQALQSVGQVAKELIRSQVEPYIADIKPGSRTPTNFWDMAQTAAAAGQKFLVKPAGAIPVPPTPALRDLTQHLLEQGTDPDDVYKLLHTFLTPNGTILKQIPDQAMTLKRGMPLIDEQVWLDKLIDHSQLFKELPELKYWQVRGFFANPRQRGGASPYWRRIDINANMPEQQQLETLLHEMTHAAGAEKGFEAGANYNVTIDRLLSTEYQPIATALKKAELAGELTPTQTSRASYLLQALEQIELPKKAAAKYLNDPGEVLARDIAARARGLTPAEESSIRPLASVFSGKLADVGTVTTEEAGAKTAQAMLTKFLQSIGRL